MVCSRHSHLLFYAESYWHVFLDYAVKSPVSLRSPFVQRYQSRLLRRKQSKQALPSFTLVSVSELLAWRLLSQGSEALPVFG
jgi:hypothetical protein